MVGSLLGWKSLLTNLRTREDYEDHMSDEGVLDLSKHGLLTLPTAASPRRTSLTLLLGFGAEALAASVMEGEDGLLARKLRPTPYSDSLKGGHSGP